MSCAKFEPQWAYEWQIRDSDWAQMILKLSVNLNMRKSGLAGQKMFLTRFDKISGMKMCVRFQLACQQNKCSCI